MAFLAELGGHELAGEHEGVLRQSAFGQAAVT
jgi:hypothetical protein